MLNNIIVLLLVKSLSNTNNKNIIHKTLLLKEIFFSKIIDLLVFRKTISTFYYDLSMFYIFFSYHISFFKQPELEFPAIATTANEQNNASVLHNMLLFSNNERKYNVNSSEKMMVLNRLMGLLAKEYTGFFTEWKFLNIHPETLAERYIFTLNSIQHRSEIRFLKMNRAVYYNMIVSLTLMRDPTLLVILIQKLFINTVVKRHRPLFMRVKRFLSIWYILSKYRRTVLGYSFYFKGKLGKKGSVRKRKIFSKCGQISFTNKNVRVNYKNYIIWTDTGCVGANISIFYNVYVYTIIIIHMILHFNYIYFILFFVNL